MKKLFKIDLNQRRTALASFFHVFRCEQEFWFCISAYFVAIFAVFFLFVNQARGFYRSDFNIHIANAISGGGYSINNLFLKGAYYLGRTPGCAAYLTIVVLITMLCAGVWFKRELAREGTVKDFGWSKSFLLAGSVCFLGGIYVPNVYPYFFLSPDYNGRGAAFSFCTQPWQNSTYILMRLFGLLTLILFFRIYSKYQVEGISPKEWLAFTIVLTLTNAAKPNFFIAFAPAMFLFLMKDWICSRGKSFRHAFVFSTTVLASMPILFVQKKLLFDNSTGLTENGISVTLIPFLRLVKEGNLLPLLITGLTFFALVTAATFAAKKKDDQILFGWIMLLISLGEAVFFTETGARAAAGNFGWGVHFCAYALCLLCLKRLFLLKDFMHKTAYYFTISPFILMIVTGFAYFAHLLGGGDFIV